METLKKVKSHNKGFTLIELLVVVAIIGLLASIAIFSIGPALIKARDTRRKADIKAMRDAFELYYQENGAYPNSVAWPLTSMSSETWLSINMGVGTPDLVPKYMGKSPKDPFNKAAGEYYYHIYSPWGKGYIIYARLENTADPDLSNSQACHGDTADTCWRPGPPWYMVGK